MANNQSRAQSDTDPIDPTRGGSGRSGGSLAGEPTNESITMDDIQQFLDGLDYPASQAEVVDFARKNYAPLTILDQLELLPPGSFESFDHISDTLSGIDDTARSGSR